MLYTLDVVIAFAVIMTVMSLMVTILVQMASAALALRGKNLANALSLTFQTIDSQVGEHAHALANYVLRDPILSDSLFADKTRAVAEGRPTSESSGSLSTASTARGEPWKFLTPGAMHVATAVRPGEVYRLLHELSELKQEESDRRGIDRRLVTMAGRLLSTLGVPDGLAKEAEAKLRVVQQVAGIFTTAEQQKAVINSLGNFGATVERATTQAYDRFQRWFGSAQDRAEQWFQMHVRGLTVAFSIAAAVLLQLDTVDIFHQLRAQPALAAAIAKAGSGVVADGEHVLNATDTPAYHTYLLWLQRHPLYSLARLPSPGNRDAYRAALAMRLAAGDQKVTAEWLREYDNLFSAGTAAFQKASRETYNNLKDQLGSTGFDLIPNRFLHRWQSEKQFRYFGHLLGVAITAALLSLGAPFWFNLLKNLMNLRPAVASLVEKRPQSSPALPQVPPVPTPS